MPRRTFVTCLLGAVAPAVVLSACAGLTGLSGGADAPELDGSDAVADTGPVVSDAADAVFDADADDASALDVRDAAVEAGPPVVFECVPAVAGNEVNAGLNLSTNVWPGFRFEVPIGSSVAVTEIRLNLQSASAGNVFAALVQLTGPGDVPDSANLSTGDRIANTLIGVPGAVGSVTLSAPITATLSAGWYAAVFGSGAFGAAALTASVHFNSGSGGCLNGYGLPFAIVQSTGQLVSQSATPHFAVLGTRL